jgi:hypothetical protein
MKRAKILLKQLHFGMAGSTLTTKLIILDLRFRIFRKSGFAYLRAII